jgi:hypothetical protein
MSFWRTIDWDQPWLAPYRRNGIRVCALLDGGQATHEALSQLADEAGLAVGAGRLRFVEQRELPEGEAYEAFISRTGRVPTRDKLHDLFNGLVWLAFPQIKRRLNELQAEAISQSGVGAHRGRLRDALTLFDENAALWWTREDLGDALAEREWTTLFVTNRSAWSDTQLVLFGHALLEKLVTPRKSITAHVWRLTLGATIDELVASELQADSLTERPWLAMPVLGVPGWWPPNERTEFYDDEVVFRPRTHR